MKAAASWLSTISRVTSSLSSGTTGQLALMDNDLLQALSTSQVAYLSSAQVRSLTSTQIANAGKSVAEGDYRGSEFCGACWTPDGRTLFVNLQSPGITVAITGPWLRGPL